MTSLVTKFTSSTAIAFRLWVYSQYINTHTQSQLHVQILCTVAMGLSLAAPTPLYMIRNMGGGGGGGIFKL